MRKIRRILLAILLPVVAFTGCATLYQKEGVFHNGYSDYQVSPDQFVVTFRANEHTPREKVMKYALKRASELTLQQGYRYFVVLEQMETGKHLYYPSLRLVIQCSTDPFPDRESMDAPSFLSLHDL